jgi:hypothetical protein
LLKAENTASQFVEAIALNPVGEFSALGNFQSGELRSSGFLSRFAIQPRDASADVDSGSRGNIVQMRSLFTDLSGAAQIVGAHRLRKGAFDSASLTV